MVWQYEKFKGDLAIYAFCPKCNFHHNPSRFDYEAMKCDVIYQYNFCPICGEYLYDNNFENEIEITWNERDVTELLK